MMVRKTELDTGQLVIRHFEIMESNITHLLSNCAVPTILPTCEIVEVSCDRWILPERVGLVL